MVEIMSNASYSNSASAGAITHSVTTSSLADILERVLDKGIVIAGDITIALADVQLLSIKVRLLVASVDKAREIGIDWWETDPALSSAARKAQDENLALQQRIERLEAKLAATA
jgi:hypothetical protein